MTAGAIDAFATKTKTKANDGGGGISQPGRKRRKQVLEEKSYIDEKGFLRTQTVTVWKEVDDEDDNVDARTDGGTNTGEGEKNSGDEIANATSNISNAQEQCGGMSKTNVSSMGLDKKKPKNSKGMKQQGLMVYFAVKKKK